MDIKEYILNILSNKSILELTGDKEVYFINADNPITPYVEYRIINEWGANFNENKEDFTTYQVQVDIFNEGDYTDLETEIKKQMIKNGFERDQAADLYEDKTKLFHKAMRFSITLKS